MLRSVCLATWLLAAQAVAREPVESATAATAVAANESRRVSFHVRLNAGASRDAASGRLVVYLIRDGAAPWPLAEPWDGPFFDNPQPMFGIAVNRLAPGGFAVIDDRADSFPVAPSRLPAGKYRAAAVLDRHRRDSQWRREPGNLYSKTVAFALGGAGHPKTIELELSETVVPPNVQAHDRVEIVQIKSKLLSDFRHEDVMLRAGVILPIDRDRQRRYPAVYSIPGFGGNHEGAVFVAGRLARSDADSPRGLLARNAVHVILDPEGPNGHHLFADSDNNGPVGRALIEELIPAIEHQFQLIAKPTARILTGHSSGGWSSLWLALTYPATFGACWSSAPDPVDFRAFQQTDLYAQRSFYVDPTDGHDLASYRSGGRARMTVRDENRMEEVLGPQNTSAQQWDSWQAVFGPRGKDGRPAALFDADSGAIDRRVVDHFRRYDISLQLLRDPERMMPLFRNRVHLIVGGDDNFYLNRAVKLIKTRIASFQAKNRDPAAGYIKMVPGATHGTVQRAPEARRAAQEMLDYLRDNAHIPN